MKPSWFLLLLRVSVLAVAASVRAQLAFPPFPEPDAVLQSDKAFNAVQLGPGNTFTVRQAPPDLQLDGFDFSADEKALYLEWDSGRVEVREIESKKKVSDKKVTSGPIWQIHDRPGSGDWIVTAANRTILFVDSHSGKVLRKISAEKGRFNYDIHQIIVSPDGNWLAYTTEDNGKVLDLRSDPPAQLADLKDGNVMALSPDGRALWVLSREKLFGFNVGDWKQIQETKLLDQVSGTLQPTLAVVGNGDRTVALIPSQSGLLRYELPSLQVSKVTNQPTYWVGADRSHDEVFVREFKSTAVYDLDGAPKCHWQLRPAQEFTMSSSGGWLGYRNFGKAELWSTEKLSRGCVSSH